MEIVIGIIIFLVIGFIGNAMQSQKGSSRIETKTKKKQSLKKEKLETISFQYKDREGKASARTVDLQTGKIGRKFTGYCHLREENRTFYFDRMIGEVINTKTGEISTPMELRYRIQGTKTALKALEKERLEKGAV